ncbi:MULTISPECIES: hypothetical protein [Flavobacterium]|uniref:Uncharacterized protein n=1 Tax=Flavobacterium jumunjinense TaxID=998845 RepID=A0ABV5GUB2_9FLAO|nr:MULTISPECIES: hypothetical protein [Flavobacterium]
MKISLGTIKKELVISTKANVEVTYFDDLVFYYGLNNFIPEIEVNEKLEVIKRHKFYKISQAIEVIKDLNIVIYGSDESYFFSNLIEKGDYYRRNLRELVDNDIRREEVKDWQCYKFSNAINEEYLDKLKNIMIDFYLDLNNENRIQNFNHRIEVNTVYFELHQKLGYDKDYYFKYRDLLEEISLEFGELVLINGLVYDYYLNPNQNLFEQ